MTTLLLAYRNQLDLRKAYEWDREEATSLTQREYDLYQTATKIQNQIYNFLDSVANDPVRYGVPVGMVADLTSIKENLKKLR